jgi:phosphonate transport system permease protein
MCTCRVFLIDRTPEGHFGHQAQYNQWFQKALRENNQDFNLIHVINSYQKENYTHQLHSEIRTNQSVTREEILQVKKILDKHQDKFFHLFFTWTKFFTVSDIKHWVNAFQSTPEIGSILGRMLPPSAGDESSLMIKGLIESLAIAIVSTFLGVAVALPLGILMARNINVRRSLSFGTRIGVLGLRGIPELIIAVIFVSAMGLGPVPGTLALSVTVAVFASKLFADSLEEINPAPREAVSAVGASRVQEFFSAVVPQFISPFVSNFFYLLDVFFRSSTVLGIVGGGGIGFLLISSIRVYQFKLTMAIVLSVYLIVLVIEWLGIGMRRLFK